MTLTQHLQADLGAWLNTHAVGLEDATRQVVTTCRSTSMTRPAGSPSLAHHAMVGGIVGQRLAFAIEQAPPYAALLGALRCSALTPATAARLATLWPTHAELSPTNATTIQTRPTPSGWWHLTDRLATATTEDEPMVVELFEQAARTCAELATYPLGRIGHAGPETTMARCCAGLDLLESVYRGGPISPELQQLASIGVVPVRDTVISDALRVLQRPECSLEALADLTSAAGRRYGFASPTIVPGWAEGDLLIGPAGDDGFTLLDVKTVTRVNPEAARGWWNQVLAYALLDEADRWRIQRVGLWLPRSDVLLTADVGELVDQLTAPVGEFHQLAQQPVTPNG